MKKIFKRLLAGMLCLAIMISFASCVQNKSELEAAYNNAVEEFNELAEFVNKNLDYVEQETVDELNKKADLLALYKKQIESNEKISEETENNMLTWLNNDFANFCEEAKTELEKTINEMTEAE